MHLAPLVVAALVVHTPATLGQSRPPGRFDYIPGAAKPGAGPPAVPIFDDQILTNASRLIEEGRRTFRFDTFGDEAFWGDQLELHQAIAGAKLGGVGPGVSPKTALAVGLKVDAHALPPALVQQLQQGQVNLDDPATTVALLKLKAVVGVTGDRSAVG